MNLESEQRRCRGMPLPMLTCRNARLSLRVIVQRAFDDGLVAIEHFPAHLQQQPEHLTYAAQPPALRLIDHERLVRLGLV